MFDLTSLPADAAVIGARLHLTMTRTGPSPTGNFELHRLLKSWGEGKGPPLVGHPAEIGDATWETRLYPDVRWTTPGGAPGVDFVASPSAVERITNYVDLFFTNVADDVTFWQHNPGTNFGWMLINDTEDVKGSARRFASRESLIDWPALIIEYVPQLHIYHPVLGPGRIGFTFDALAFNHYAIECRSAFDQSAWQVCTNLPLFQQSGPVTVSLPVRDAAEFYRVALHP
jgi:hypothetical protein